MNTSQYPTNAFLLILMLHHSMADFFIITVDCPLVNKTKALLLLNKESNRERETKSLSKLLALLALYLAA